MKEKKEASSTSKFISVNQVNETLSTFIESKKLTKMKKQ